MSEDKGPRRDPAININRIDLLGRVAKEPITKNPKFVRVPMVVPVWDRDGHQWVPFSIDVVGDKMEKVAKATPGDFFRCVARLVDRPIEDDGGDIKTVKTLQIDPYHDVGLMPGEANEVPFISPEYYGICYSRVLVAGRNFLRKKELEERKTPKLYDKGNGPFAFVKVRFEDPFQPPPSGDEKYFQSMFFDVAVNGDRAKVVAEHCRSRAQIVLVGELVRKECNFTANGGKTPKEPSIRLIPGGLHFNNLDFSGGGGTKEPAPVQQHDDPKDTDGVPGLDEDIPF